MSTGSNSLIQLLATPSSATASTTTTAAVAVGTTAQNRDFSSRFQQQCRTAEKTSSTSAADRSDAATRSASASSQTSTADRSSASSSATRPTSSKTVSDKADTPDQPASDGSDTSVSGDSADTPLTVAPLTLNDGLAVFGNLDQNLLQLEMTASTATVGMSPTAQTAAGVSPAAVAAGEVSATVVSGTGVPATAAALQQQLSQETGVEIYSLTVTANSGTGKTSTAAGTNVQCTANAVINTTAAAAGSNGSTAAATSTGTENGTVVIDSSSQKDLLKSLDNDLHSAALRSHANAKGDNPTEQSSTAANGSIKTAVTSAILGEPEKKSASTTSDSATEAHSALLHAASSANASDTTANGLTTLLGTAGTPAFTSAAERVTEVEQILDQIKSNLPLSAAADGSSGNGVKIDFNAGSLGRIQMQMQQQGNTIQVTISANSDSAQQQLLDQQQNMAQTLRNLGYQDLSVIINNQRQQQQQRSFQQQSQTAGNEDIDNVKLGSDTQEDDLLELLTAT